MSKSLDGRKGPVLADRSGSAWGEDELDTYRFEKQPQNFSLKDFPWRDLFLDLGADPIADILSILYDMFGPGAESRSSLSAAKASTFYSLLRELIRQPPVQDIKNIPQTRSMGVDYSSPSLPSASTWRLESTTLRDLDSQTSFTESTPCPTGLGDISDHK